MSKKEIKKNFEMGAQFNQFLISHPELLEDIPENAQVVLVSNKEKILSQKNIELAREIKEGGNPVIQAVQEGKEWTLKPLKL